MTTTTLGLNNKNYTQHGQYSGPMYDVDHLATFAVGAAHGLLNAEDGVRKLRILEKSQGVWPMDCKLQIDTNFLIIYDKENGNEVEKFPIELISDPTSVVSDDKKDSHNNMLLFTVLEDLKKNKSLSNQIKTQSQMHLFQCLKNSSTDIVDEIFKAKETRAKPDPISDPRSNTKAGDSFDINNNSNNVSLKSNIQPQLKRGSLPFNPKTEQKNPNQIELELQTLNHCFDDIERFVTRLQNSSEYLKELEKRQKKRKSSKKHLGDGMLTMRAQMPPPDHYLDIFQKFKHSFNLLAKLKTHIHDPNAPELVHFLFTPLALIMNTTNEEPYLGLGKSVWQPMLNREAKDLLVNCLTSKEHDLWTSLGEAWTVTRDEAKLQPHLHVHIENQAFIPVFYDGWTPNVPVNDQADLKADMSRLAYASAAQVQRNQQAQPQSLAMQKSRFNSIQEEQIPNSGNSVNKATNKSVLSSAQQPLGSGNSVQQNPAKIAQIRNYEEMKKWAIDLTLRGAKVHEVVHDRQANNDKELTVKSGELVEVLDDKRNWWKLRNFYGQIGHAPVTILRQFEFAEDNVSQNSHKFNKVGYY